EQGKDIWICGGSDVIDQCVRADLIDEYHITTLPLILGGGIPLFKSDGPMRRLKLLRVSSTSGLANMIYERKQSEYDE
ncbi:MAG: dihydrofolate reductase family protein, partial [Merdibacter sp.]